MLKWIHKENFFQVSIIWLIYFTDSYATQLAEANIHANMVDLALPGMLPVLNSECLDIALRCSLALEGCIAPKIKFDRKHYFYADLP